MGKIFVSIETSALDPKTAMDFIADPGHGAMDIFVGMVRDHNLGKKVRGVSYDVFEPLALQILRDLCQLAQNRFGSELNIYLAHFKGRLDISGISVIIAVSSPHRDESFQACRYLIEELKQQAPIWKQEHYVDGDSEWVKGHALCAHHHHKKPATDFTGVVLAGGKSSRMGRNKALMTFHNMRLIDNAIGVLSTISTNQVQISGMVEGYKSIIDQVSDFGPMAGICSSVLSNQECKRWLFLPVDMPLITSDALQQLIDGSSGKEAICFKNNPLPLFLQITDSVLNHITQTLVAMQNGQEVSVKHFISRLDTGSIPVSPNTATALTNINTGSEWSQLNHES